LLIAFVIFCALVTLTCSDVYWRDAGEFIIAGFYLDISHPAGYPTYGQLSNLIALMPLGPITWRIATFSALASFGCLVLAWHISRLLLIHESRFAPGAASALALVAPTILLSVPAFARQALSVEVYPLNCFFILLLFLLYYRFHLSSDIRFIYTAAFISGIALGNHVSSAAALGLALIILATHGSRILKILPQALMFGLFGFAIYAYLPARALSDLPLRSGYPITAERLWNLMSDARDRALRLPQQLEGVSTSGVNLPFEHLVKTAPGDLRKISGELGLAACLFGLAGAILLLTKNPRASLLFTGSGLLTWAFFNGWDPDPWLPLFSCVAVLSVFALGALPGALRMPCAFLLAFYGFWNISNTLPELQALSKFNLTRITAQDALRKAPRGAVYLTEASWFPFAYLHYVEGFRSDLSLVYQPRVLFPYYFEPIVIADSGSSGFSTTKLLANRSSEPALNNLGTLIQSIGARAPFTIEPSIVVNSFLKDVSQLRSDGTMVIEFNQSANFDSKYVDAQLTRYQRLASSIRAMPKSLADDTRNYMETVLVNDVALLQTLGEKSEALRLYQGVCLPAESSPCSPGAPMNIAAFRQLQAK